jgi:hypothetical protein
MWSGIDSWTIYVLHICSTLQYTLTKQTDLVLGVTLEWQRWTNVMVVVWDTHTHTTCNSTQSYHQINDKIVEGIIMLCYSSSVMTDVTVIYEWGYISKNAPKCNPLPHVIKMAEPAVASL